MNEKLKYKIIEAFLNYKGYDDYYYDNPSRMIMDSATHIIGILSFYDEAQCGFHFNKKYYDVVRLVWDIRRLDFCLIVNITQSKKPHSSGSTHYINLKLRHRPQVLEYLSLKHDSINFKSYLES